MKSWFVRNKEGIGIATAIVLIGTLFGFIMEPTPTRNKISQISYSLETLQREIQDIKKAVGPYPVEHGSWPRDLKVPLDAKLRQAIRDCGINMLEGERLMIERKGGIVIWTFTAAKVKSKPDSN